MNGTARGVGKPPAIGDILSVATPMGIFTGRVLSVDLGEGDSYEVECTFIQPIVNLPTKR